MQKGEYLPLMEHYYTIQGEGFHTGKPAHFIRLLGCSVGCVWCDVKESWKTNLEKAYPISDIVNLTQKSDSELVVITGGEPTEYNLNLLTKELRKSGKKTLLETSGAYTITGKWDWICVSPKKFKQPLEESLHQANELKCIIYNQSDFDWAEKSAQNVPDECKLYLQPEWSKKDTMLPKIIEYVKKHPKWQISLQTHKYIGIP